MEIIVAKIKFKSSTFDQKRNVSIKTETRLKNQICSAKIRIWSPKFGENQIYLV